MNFILNTDMLLNATMALKSGVRINGTELDSKQQKRLNCLIDKMHFGVKFFTSADFEALLSMIAEHGSYTSIKSIKTASLDELWRSFWERKRAECHNIPYFTKVFKDWERESDKRVKIEKLKRLVYLLIQEDARRYGREWYSCNGREAVSLIHKDYAAIIGIGVEDVSSSIRELEKEGRIFEEKTYLVEVLKIGKGGKAVVNLVEGYMYIPFMCKKNVIRRLKDRTEVYHEWKYRR